MDFDKVISIEQRIGNKWIYHLQTNANIRLLNKNDYYKLGGVSGENLVKFEVEKTKDIVLLNLNPNDYRIVTLENGRVWKLVSIDLHSGYKRRIANIYGYKKT